MLQHKTQGCVTRSALSETPLEPVPRVSNGYALAHHQNAHCPQTEVPWVWLH